MLEKMVDLVGIEATSSMPVPSTNCTGLQRAIVSDKDWAVIMRIQYGTFASGTITTSFTNPFILSITGTLFGETNLVTIATITSNVTAFPFAQRCAH